MRLVPAAMAATLGFLMPSISFGMLLPGLLMASMSGVLGGIFARLLIYSLHTASRHWVHQFRRDSPIWFAGACGLLRKASMGRGSVRPPAPGTACR